MYMYGLLLLLLVNFNSGVITCCYRFSIPYIIIVIVIVIIMIGRRAQLKTTRTPTRELLSPFLRSVLSIITFSSSTNIKYNNLFV